MATEENKTMTEAEIRTAAVKELLKASESDENHTKLEHIEMLERRAKMTPVEQLDDIAKQAQKPYSEDQMQQRFDCLKDIQHVNGFIYLIADTAKSRVKAMDKAIAIFGEHADPQELLNYAEQHTLYDTVMSVYNFEKHLRLIITMAAQAPHYFGYGRGGSELKEVIERGKAAMREAHEWFKKHNNEVSKDLYDALCGDETICTDEKKFRMLLGEHWEELIEDRDNIHAVGKLLFT
jgi:hypothetical protein